MAAAALGLTGAGAAGARSIAFDEASRTASTSTADAQLAAILSFNREEERMARDLYRLFSNTYNGAAPFSRIVLSEQRHFEAIGRLLTTYRIPDPSAGRPAGSYADPALQSLYTTWRAQGLISRTEAAKVGVTLEKRDIADLKKSIAATTKTDVKNVLSSCWPRRNSTSLPSPPPSTEPRWAAAWSRGPCRAGVAPMAHWDKAIGPAAAATPWCATGPGRACSGAGPDPVRSAVAS
ncbi:ferritin-like domain-containing protein [Nostocoides australiense]|uniref:ferritin-like domain-containing protein n=1 Tax=Nostocoides australiense TaxID=99480 RepID=UPI00065FBD4F|nr:DUF2202 domain-containing protein [Tetrasphaera australiensis]